MSANPAAAFNFAEWIKYTIVPPQLNMWRLVRKALRQGEAELRLLSQLVDPARIAVDVGANKGVYSHLLSRLCPQVIAFEPQPKVFRMLRRGLRANVTAHNVALSDRSGDAELFIPGRRGKYSTQLASLREVHRAAEGTVVRVPTRTLDSYELRDVGFVKIDVEGFEQSVLRGARETLARERPVLLLEMEERHTGTPIEQSIATVEGYGYDVFIAINGRLRSVSTMIDARGGTDPAWSSANNFIAKPRQARGAQRRNP